MTRILTTPLGRSRKQAGTAALAPWIEIPLDGGVWLSAGARLEWRYPEFERANRRGSREGRFQVGLKLDKMDLAAAFSFVDFLDPRDEPDTSLINANFLARVYLPHKLQLEGRAGYKRWEYLVEGLTGPDAATWANALIRQDLPLGFSLRALGAIEQRANTIFSDVPTWGRVAADGLTTSGQFRIVAEPVPWLHVSASQLWTGTKWDVINPEAKSAFEKNTVNWASQQTVLAEVVFPL